jgi:hypothetical protein
MRLTIAEIALGQGALGLCPMPGRSGAYAADLTVLQNWHPDLVISLTTGAELARIAPNLAADLAAASIAWRAFPIADFDIPGEDWPSIAAAAHACLGAGGKVLLHCMGGCGRSGSVALRLMVETGEAAADAFTRLRAARPCAVETDAQYRWASLGFI